MFSKSSFAVVFALLSTFVVAFPANGGCGNTGDLHCCNVVQSSDSKSIIDLFDLMGQGPQLAGSTGQAGVACSPITGTGGPVSCQQQTACCSNTSFNGFLATGCSTVIRS